MTIDFIHILSLYFSSLAQVWFIVPLLIVISVMRTRWFKGAFGELMVNKTLSRLPKEGYTVLKNITLATEDGTTQIDHIVVSRFGVFVVETKNMKGWIFGSAHQKQWTQRIYRYSYKFQNPLHQNYKHIKTLEAILNCSPTQIHSLVIFIGNGKFKTEMPNNVTHVKHCLTYIRSFKEPIIPIEQANEIVKILGTTTLKSGMVTDHKHRQHVKDIVKSKANRQVCPCCGSDMVVRKSKRGKNVGEQFWGCSTFPKCKMVIKYN